MQPTKYQIPYNINLKSEEFVHVVNELIEKHDIEEIVETGAFNGLGSTMVFAKTGKSVFSIECNRNNFFTASENLKLHKNVCLIHGLSLKRNDLIEYIINADFKKEVTMDSKHPKVFYMQEIMQDVIIEDALSLLTKNTNKQLVFLDSAGGVGYFEFLSFMDMDITYLENKVLLLDDVDHVKHKDSVVNLRKRYKEVNVSKDNRFAWCDLSKSNYL